jgi:signal transduction histidine kinase
MRSVRTKMLLFSFGILVFSLGGFLVISRTMTYKSFAQRAPIGRNAMTQFEEASLEYENGGPKALSAYLRWQHQYYPGLRFFFVRNGVDLVTGEDRSRLLAMAKSRWALVTIASPMIVAIPSPDSEDAFIVEMPPQDAMYDLPYYLLLLCAITILCWGLAYQFASPLNRLAETVRRFGAGDLTARVYLRRSDEIGDVVLAFDQMAGRIETLVTAERRLLQDISHELRSPLARLSLAAELVRTSPDREAAVMRVHQEIDRLTDLSESLLQATREEGDFTARRLENVGLDPLIRKLVQDCEIEAASRRCNFVVTGASHQQMRADPELLRRAIENIFRNAILHAPTGSIIEVALNDTTMNASVSVRDYGPGVPPETLTQIFRPFFRVDDSRNTATGGIGLGLAIAQRAIHVHRGQIWAENAEPGLRVCIDLPLETAVG